MSERWDLTAYNRDSQLALVVEAKSKVGTTPQWAAQFRRNIAAHGNFPNAPYFLLAFPDSFYLWKNTAANLQEIEPNYVIDAGPILQPYFEQAGVAPQQLSGQSLELIVASWMSEVIHKPADALHASEQWLVESGLYDAVAGGSLGHEVVA